MARKRRPSRRTCCPDTPTIQFPRRPTLRDYRGSRWQAAELAQDGHVVPGDPELGELAVLKATDRPEVKPDLLLGRRERSHLSQLCAFVGCPDRGLIAIGEDMGERLHIV